MSVRTDPAPLDEIERGVWLGLLRAHAAVTRQLDAELTATCGMALADYEALFRLSQAPGRQMRMSELAESVLLSRSGLTRAVDRLVTAGWVHRASCPRDARGSYAVLTDAGAAALAAAYPVHLAGVRRHVLDAVPPVDRPTVAAALAAVAGSGGELPCPG